MEGWKTLKLDDLAKIERGHFSPRPRNDPRYYGGDIPFVQTGDVSRAGIYIQEYSQTLNEKGLAVSKLFPKNTILMTIAANVGDVAILGFDSACPDSLVAFLPKKDVNHKWLFHVLRTMKNKFDSLSTQNAQKNLSLEKIKPVKIPVPPLAFQNEMALALDLWDATIEKTEALIRTKQQQFGWLATKLINGSGYHKALVGDIVQEVSARNRNNTIERVLSVTNHSGFVLPEDQFERRIASASLSNYKIVQRGQYAYNPSRINVGSIARLDDWDDGVLSPMYVVFALDKKKADSDYFLHWLSSSEARQRIKNSAQGSVRETVSFGDLGGIPISLPPLPEQQRIAHTLNTAQTEIRLLQQLAEQYRTQKRGLMQKLLTGEWRIGSDKEAAA